MCMQLNGLYGFACLCKPWSGCLRFYYVSLKFHYQIWHVRAAEVMECGGLNLKLHIRPRLLNLTGWWMNWVTSKHQIHSSGTKCGINQPPHATSEKYLTFRAMCVLPIQLHLRIWKKLEPWEALWGVGHQAWSGRQQEWASHPIIQATCDAYFGTLCV